MDIYFTSKNTGPSWESDPTHLIYVGTSLDEAIAAVGDFVKYEVPTEMIEHSNYPETYSALPKEVERTYWKFYTADGWWYSIAEVNFEE